MIEVKAAVSAPHSIDTCREVVLQAFQEIHLDILYDEPTRIRAREPYTGVRENSGLITVEANLRRADDLATRIDLTATSDMSGTVATHFAEHHLNGILRFLDTRIHPVRLSSRHPTRAA